MILNHQGDTALVVPTPGLILVRECISIDINILWRRVDAGGHAEKTLATPFS